MGGREKKSENEDENKKYENWSALPNSKLAAEDGLCSCAPLTCCVARVVSVGVSGSGEANGPNTNFASAKRYVIKAPRNFLGILRPFYSLSVSAYPAFKMFSHSHLWPCKSSLSHPPKWGPGKMPRCVGTGG